MMTTAITLASIVDTIQIVCSEEFVAIVDFTNSLMMDSIFTSHFILLQRQILKGIQDSPE